MPKRKKGINSQKKLVKFAKALGSLVIIGVVLLLIPLSLPILFGYETFDVITGSMEPEIPVGSMIFVKKIDPKTIEEDDIIAFYQNSGVICHRVVKNNKFEEKITTKGDANNDKDLHPVMYNDVIGIVTHHIPFMGTIGSYFSTTSGKLLLAELLICSVMLHIVADKIKV